MKDVGGDFEENIDVCGSAHFANLSVGLLFFIHTESLACEIPGWDAFLDFCGAKEDCMCHLLASFMKFSKEFQFYHGFA